MLLHRALGLGYLSSLPDAWRRNESLMGELYVREDWYDDPKASMYGMRPASPSEVVAAARQHVDYEAAADWLRRVGLAGVVTDDMIEGGFVAMAQEAINAAFGIEGEEGT